MLLGQSVTPEFIFDQRAGSIFEVRNAGNVVDEDVLASFEYAVAHLHTPLMVVLAHKGCGAIHAVCEAGDAPLHDHLSVLQEHMSGIRQEVAAAPEPHGTELLHKLSLKNAEQQAQLLLRDSKLLQSAVESGQARLIYGVYDMESGTVEFFEL